MDIIGGTARGLLLSPSRLQTEITSRMLSFVYSTIYIFVYLEFLTTIFLLRHDLLPCFLRHGHFG
jgi:hypothetical protein